MSIIVIDVADNVSHMTATQRHINFTLRLIGHRQTRLIDCLVGIYAASFVLIIFTGILQYYVSIYHDTSQSVVILAPQP